MNNLSAGGKAWVVFGALIVLGVVAMTLRELPAMRREMRILKM
jgi:hypothetical protein